METRWIEELNKNKPRLEERAFLGLWRVF